MPTAAWPTSLPQKILADGYTEKPRTGVVRTGMDVGVAKMRQRYSAVITDITAQLRLSTVQAATFEAFFKTTLLSGSLPFTWLHPRTGAAVTMRFMEPPQVVPEARGMYWEVTMALEILP